MRHLLSAAVLASCAALAVAAPPSLDFPAENRPANGYVIVEPKTDAKSVVYVALDGVFPFPSSQLRDPRSFVLPAGGLKDGTYRFMAVAASETGDQVTKLLTVVVGAPVPDDGKRPPVVIDPPHPPAAKLYFLVVRPDGPASAAFTKLMAMPEWQTLRGQGHKVKDRTATEAAPILGAAPPAAGLPAVFTLAVSPDGKSSTIVRPAVPLGAATGADILKLPEVK